MPLHATAVRAPEILLALARHLLALDARQLEPDVVLSHALLDADPDIRLLAQLDESALDERTKRELASWLARFDANDPQMAGELSYGRWVPFEVVPFAWQGGDALHYGHLVMAEELGLRDWMAVSFAPEETIVSWLGDDTSHALANMLATRGAHDAADEVEPVEIERAREARAVLSLALGLPAGEVLSRGARSKRRAVPSVPPGYRHTVGREGVGVLAPVQAFADLDAASVDFEALEDRAAAALADGHPATALELLARQRREADGEGERAACERMVAVYEALGRPIMARRVEAHLRVSLFS